MITTYFSDEQLEEFCFVNDQELNKLLQEIRLIDDRYFLREEAITIKTFMKRPIETFLYTLIFKMSNDPYSKLINFRQEGVCSINTRVSAPLIQAYFHGFLSNKT